MKNKSLPMLLAMAALAILLFTVLFAMDKDKTAPEIEFSDKCISTFGDDDDVSLLLKGVSATDKKDGNVSGTLKIQNVVVLSDEGQIIVHYSAKDNSNNVVQAQRTIEYTGTKTYIDIPIVSSDLFEDEGGEAEMIPVESSSTEKETESSSETKADTNTSGSTENNTDESTSEEETSEEETTEEPTTREPSSEVGDVDTSPIDKAEVDATGIPQIRMEYSSLTISVGSDFNYMDPLLEWYDDKDDVSRRVIIIGEYDVNVAGTYKLRYYVTDSDGNRSNIEDFTLIVE